MENISVTISIDQCFKEIVTKLDFITIVVYPNNELAPRRMSKKDYSKRSRISERTLRNYLNNGIIYEKLKRMGYSKNQRMLSIPMVAFLDKELAITPEDE